MTPPDLTQPQRLDLEEGKRLLSEKQRLEADLDARGPRHEYLTSDALDAAAGYAHAAFMVWLQDQAERLLSAAEEAEKLRELRLATTTSDTFATLPQHQRAQAEAIAQMLRTATGSYRGSETDALTDACAIVIAAQFAPPLGDNHHNARACPYCTPSEPQETP